MQTPINFEVYLNDPTSEASIAECKRVAHILHTYGALAIRDPRVTFADNGKFLDMIEQYFEQDEETKLKDARPELHYQVGPTPGNTEVPRCAFDPDCKVLIENVCVFVFVDFQQTEENRAILPTGADVKWRYFHVMGTPVSEKFPVLNAGNVVPAAFEDRWTDTMNAWGSKLLQAAFTLAEMLAVGLDLDKSTFTDMLTNGPHLLAPTASDLVLGFNLLILVKIRYFKSDFSRFPQRFEFYYLPW